MLLLCAAVDGSRRRAREGGGAIRAAVWAEALVREASIDAALRRHQSYRDGDTVAAPVGRWCEAGHPLAVRQLVISAGRRRQTASQSQP